MKKLNLLSIVTITSFLWLGAFPETYASQSVFTDPSAGSCTDVAPTNTGTGTCTMGTITAFNSSETITFTATSAGPTASFTVSGSSSGSLGTITSGSAQTVIDTYGFTRFTVTLSDAGTGYVAGDNFQVVLTAGADLKKANFDLFTFAQVCSNGCIPTAVILGNLGSVNLPGYSFTGDTNTGMYSAGADLLGLATNGTRAISIDTTQQVSIRGFSSNTAATAGDKGEIISSCVSSGSAVSLSTATWTNVTSISLTVGSWKVTGKPILTLNTGTGLTQFQGAVSINSGATTTDHVAGDNVLFTPSMPTGAIDSSLSIPDVIVRVSGTTTDYLKVNSAFSGGTVKAYGCIVAERFM